MSNFQTKEIALYQILKLFPKTFAKEIFLDADYQRDNKIIWDMDIVLGNQSAEFSRSNLFGAARRAFSSADYSCYVKDNDGDEWNVLITDDGSMALLQNGVFEFRIDSLWPLNNDLKRRVEVFKNLSLERNFNDDEVSKWLNVLSAASISDLDAYDVVNDLNNTPHFIAKQYFQNTNNNAIDIQHIVPQNVEYYERLIGSYLGAENINEYSSKELRIHFESRRFEGNLRPTLLLSSHRSISHTISHYISDENEYRSLVALGIHDPISAICMIEIGINRFLTSCEPLIEELITALFSAKGVVTITNLSALALFIDGELSRLKILNDKPPFYRRLASFSQASLLLKAGLELDIDYSELEVWANEQRGMLFYCQTFIDLRKEPRWLPGYIISDQLKNEYLGRLFDACNAHPSSSFCVSILDRLSKESLIKVDAFLSGPLEGNIDPLSPPELITGELEKKLSEGGSNSFSALIFSARFWKIDEKHTDRIVELLQTAKHQLSSTDDKDSISNILTGLSLVASVGRNQKLAKSVLILTKTYRAYLNVNSNPQNITAIGLIAAAAHAELSEWAVFIGGWFNEMVYLPLEPLAISNLKAVLEQLCILEPSLYYTCGKQLEILRNLDD